MMMVACASARGCAAGPLGGSFWSPLVPLQGVSLRQFCVPGAGVMFMFALCKIRS